MRLAIPIMLICVALCAGKCSKEQTGGGGEVVVPQPQEQPTWYNRDRNLSPNQQKGLWTPH